MYGLFCIRTIIPVIVLALATSAILYYQEPNHCKATGRPFLEIIIRTVCPSSSAHTVQWYFARVNLYLFIQLVAIIATIIYIRKQWKLRKTDNLIEIVVKLSKKSDDPMDDHIANDVYKHLIEHSRLYGLKYMYCDFVCLVNLVGQMLFMDWYLGDDYLLLGINFFKHPAAENILQIIPTRSICKYHNAYIKFKF